MHFLQVSQARSGTHMLRDVFMNHPDVDHWYDYRGAIAHLPGELPKAIEKWHAGLRDDVTTGVMHHFGEEYAANSIEWRDHWRKLRGLHDYCIILIRRNSVRQWLSKKIAERDIGNDGSWASMKPREHTPEPIRFDLYNFILWNRFRKYIESTIRPYLKPYMQVYYEDLCADWEQVSLGVFRHLGLRWNNPVPATFKQETRPVKEIISNWREVMLRASKNSSKELQEIRNQLRS